MAQRYPPGVGAGRTWGKRDIAANDSLANYVYKVLSHLALFKILIV